MAVVALSSVPLSSLCSVCHTKPPKYTCPGCSAHSCSVSCVKLHKKRKSCNGQRDPGKYVPTRDLAQPAQLDKDYNFISGVERRIESANRDAVHRGIVEDDDGHATGPGRGQVPLKRSLEADGITIREAPKAMTRSKSNKTRWRPHQKDKVGQVSWTIEWIWTFYAMDSTGQRRLLSKTITDQCTESMTISEAWIQARRIRSRGLIEKELDRLAETIREYEASGDRQDRTDPGWREKEVQATSNLAQQLKWWRETPDKEKYNFYLDAPDLRVPGKQALIPVDGWASDVTLKDLLKGRTLLEYPTIAVWSGDVPRDDYLVLDSFKSKSKQGKEQEVDSNTAYRKRAATEEDTPRLRPSKKGKSVPHNDAAEAQATKGFEDTESVQPQAQPEGDGQQKRVEVSKSAGASKLALQDKAEVAGDSVTTSSNLKGLVGLDYSSD